jgi:hypothetical protein
MLEEWGALGAVAALVMAMGGLALWASRARSGASRGAAPSPEQPRGDVAAEALLRVVRSELERGHNEAAVAHWLALVAAGLDAHADATLSIRMAALLRDGGRRDEAAAALRSALRRSGGPTTLAVSARVARAAVDVDPQLAVDAAWRALSCDELDPLDRRDLERLLAGLQGRGGIEPTEETRAGEAAPAREEPEAAAPAPPAEARRRPEPIELGHRPRRLEVVLGIPLAIETAGLRVALESRDLRLVGWREIDAIAVCAVDGLGAKPVLVVDLIAGWRRPADEPLRIVRLRGDRFDPRKVVDSGGSPVDALRDLVDRLLAETGGEPLPDLRAARGRPFAGFRDLTAFEEEVLMAEEGGSDAEGASARR